MERQGKLGLAVALIVALATPGVGQQRTRGLDPTSGRRERPHQPQQEGRSPLKLRSVGGPVLGYTTDLVTPHTATLDELISAAEDLAKDGHTLVPLDTLSAESLAPIDRLFIGLLAQPLPASAMDAVEAFVRDGGDLVYLGDNNRSWFDENTQVAGRFGVPYPQSDPFEVILTAVVDHPITNGPFGQVSVMSGPRNAPRFFGSMAGPGPYGQSLVLFPDGNAAVVVIEPGAFAPGAGSVISLSDFNVFSNNYSFGDNRALWRNVFAYDPPLTRVVFDFETEDDFETPLANGQGVRTPDEFGRTLSLEGFGPHTYGAAVFDSSPGGPNAFGSDPDLLVDLGNVLILQENGLQSVPDFYDDLDDAQLGGTFAFDFAAPARAESIDLIDICLAPPLQDVTLTLWDASGAMRLFLVPGGWTNDRFQDGPTGYGTLNLLTLDPQPGFAATTTASETLGFDPDAVVRMEVALASSGALDNLVVDLDPDPQPLQIVACSLGCEAGELTIGCAQSDVFLNGEIRVTFNQPVDLASVNNASFRLIDVANGTTPPGIYRLDPVNPNVLIYTPQITFDSRGNPVFGFEEGATYSWVVPGTLTDPLGPWIQSQGGEANLKRLQCTLVASGVLDATVGRPTASGFVHWLNPETNELELVPFSTNFPAVRSTDVLLGFNDIMNPSTLLDPQTGESPSIAVEVDTDGSGPAGSEPVAGSFQITIDQLQARTLVVFDPAELLPAGAIVTVTIAPIAEDLAGNSVLNTTLPGFSTAD